MAARRLYLGIDLGGTNIKAGVVGEDGKALSSVSIPTEADRGPEHGIQRLCQAGREAALAAKVTMADLVGFGVGSPGPMDLEQQLIINPHNLPGWINLKLAERIGKELGLPGVLQNDANASGYGEHWAGAGRGQRSLVLFTLGTGIGCGIVIDGQIIEGRHSHGAECGHMRIDLAPNARLNGTGLRGSLEAYASASAVVERAEEALAAGAEAPILRKALASGAKLSSKTIFESGRQGDPLGARIEDETAFYLAIGAINLMHTIDPDVVAYSGGMIKAGPPFLARIRKYVLENALPIPAARTEIRYAELGEDSGFIGAAGCARLKFGAG